MSCDFSSSVKCNMIGCGNRNKAEHHLRVCGLMIGKGTLVWFRNDLRIGNNPALFEACKYASNNLKEAPVFGLVVISPYEWRQVHHWGLAKADYWLRTARELQISLKNLNIPLLVHHVDGADKMKSKHEYYATLGQGIADVCKKHGIDNLFHNLEYDGPSLDRDKLVHEACEAAGIAIQTFHDQCVVPVGKLSTKSGTPFKVFTQFKKTWAAYIEEHGIKILPPPKPAIKLDTENDELPEYAPGFDCKREFPDLDLAHVQKTFPAGESAAETCLQNFLRGPIKNYQEDRNQFSNGGVSRLSAPLAVGSISLSQCLMAARNANQGHLMTGQAGLVMWINELCWRDFYRHVLVAFPHVGHGHSFRPEYDSLPFRGWPGVEGEQGAQVEEQFDRWCKGQTGVPIVDAAMRQLRQEAWQSNRLRMVVAMYLTKDLLIHWRRGERFFQEHLIDYDYASNNGGWQWSASTGTDAQPYFRVFNPLLQSEKFDPSGEFIRMFVGELANVSAPAIHDPYGRLSKEKFKQLNYPAPMVNHQKAKEQAIALFTGNKATNKRKYSPTFPME